MGPTKKSRVVKKCSSKANEEWPDNDGTSTNNRKIRKRKLSDALGSRWSKEDLKRFYEAYRTYGKDWKKVAAVIRNRSTDMLEALYNMNRAYLSLPEGRATAAGLVAMMTDNYNMLDGSDNDRDSNQVSKAFHKPQKHGHGKPQPDMPKGYEGPHPDYLQNQSAVSSSGCLRLSKNRFGDLFGGNWPRDVGKRTPRLPVPFWHDNNERNNIISPKRHDLNFREDAAAAEGVHGAVLALVEASQRGRPSQISETCDRKVACVRSSPMWSGKTGHAEPGMSMTNPDYNSVGIDGESVQGNLDSIEADNGGFASDARLSDIDGTGASKIQGKVNKLQEKKSKGPGIQIHQFDDASEACSGAEEGHYVRHVKDEIDTEVREQKTAIGLQDPGKKSHKLFSPDESCALDALQGLADLSVKILLPDSASKSKSSEHANERKRSVDSAFTSNMPGSMSAKQESDKSRISVIKERGYSSDVGVHVVQQKSVHKNLSPNENSKFEARKTDYPSVSEMSKRKRKHPAEMEALLTKLREMNEEVAGKKKDRDPERDLGHFRKQYPMVFLRLQEASNQVVEIVENSMSKASKMVDVAVQAMSSMRDGEDALTCIGEALESKNNQCFGTEVSKSGIRRIPHPGNDNRQNQAVSCILQPATTHVLSPRVQFSSADVPQIPSELISSCVATVLMIQACTVRQHPPAEVAQILEYAVTSLQPCCSQNLPIYREIETLIGIIKNQMLALIPSLSTNFCPEVSVYSNRGEAK